MVSEVIVLGLWFLLPPSLLHFLLLPPPPPSLPPSFSSSLFSGILLHYATPALNHLYFIDPQWLCDMLAHVVTVPEVNRFIQRGSGNYIMCSVSILYLAYDHTSCDQNISSTCS